MSINFRGSGKGLAFLIHLGLSSLAVGVLAVLMIQLWYPPPFFMFDGGWQVLRIVLLVDVVVGPLLTLVVFNRSKPELKRDLTIIGAVQIAAFAYGAWVMHAYRPAYIVFAERAFYSVHWPDIRRATRDTAAVERLATGRHGPAPVVVIASIDQRRKIYADMSAGGPSITNYGDFYRALDVVTFEQIARGPVDIESVARGDASVAAELARVRTAHPLPRDRLVFVPLDCRYGLIMLVFDRETRAIIDKMT